LKGVPSVFVTLVLGCIAAYITYIFAPEDVFRPVSPSRPCEVSTIRIFTTTS
jgi:hypothetical protein